MKSENTSAEMGENNEAISQGNLEFMMTFSFVTGPSQGRKHKGKQRAD